MKNKKLAKILCSLALALALALCCLPAAYAYENITVDFSFYNADVVIPKTEITVYDGIAEEYGYVVASVDHNGIAVDNATAFDAIVAAHKMYYGDSFTIENCTDYLSISSSFVTKAFGVNTSSFGLFVNDKVPHDGIYVDAYGGYTGYAFDTAEIKNNDYISLYTYQDPYYADYYVIPSVKKLDIKTGEEFTLSAKGYSAMWYGTSTDEMKEQNTYKLSGLNVYTTKDYVTYTQAGTLDENGEITLSFAEAGTVYICLKGNFTDPVMGNLPTVANWCEINITEQSTDKPDEDCSDAVYFPMGIDLSLNTDSESGLLRFDILVHLKDVKTNAPEITKNICFEIQLGFIMDIIKLISKIM